MTVYKRGFLNGRSAQGWWWTETVAFWYFSFTSQAFGIRFVIKTKGTSTFWSLTLTHKHRRTSGDEMVWAPVWTCVDLSEIGAVVTLVHFFLWECQFLWVVCLIHHCCLHTYKMKNKRKTLSGEKKLLLNFSEKNSSSSQCWGAGRSEIYITI